MKRKDNWREELFKYVAASVREPYAPGKNDCALFSAGAVKAMTGVDLAKGWRGKYRTLAGGYKQLKKKGFDSLPELAAAHFPEIPALMAQVGDLAVVDAPDGEALGVVQGARVWLRLEEGLGFQDITDVKRAFRV